MVLEIVRFKEIDDMTLGRFVLRDGEREVLKGYTCEPAGPDTTQSGMDRRIPQGQYQIAWHESSKFRARLPLLYNEQVPKSRCILIHAGNTGSNTEGCVLLGSSLGTHGVKDSRAALSALLATVKGQEFIVKIKNEIER
ncbi:DUF5675 family protein [Campylobacter gracilis]|uniref:DUF5675 domain-containing protein n=1 Tax=Campylobacter gracilis RM3268 TaxID=553220 RepID=C8PII1_9BACT|nr:DUF5675 family protein [Campylobacter gracilis]AKT92088.1 hypothetical protein CGRAC_0633 [Campylobacter gracilis]EEV17346.1 hypothetical protein CAMGR0001_1642 [Campylobacter gracilis RM3268]UEB45718.1 DUF5675 family protein [Campylobacter gracilis]SUW81604.1 Uncharacterised protein [Campylobacter gracilis]